MTQEKNNYRLEACVTSTEQAIHSEKLGAQRIEICSRLETGGMTPDIDLVKELCKKLNIPIRVMIRPNPFGFEADQETVEAMIFSIDRFKLLPIQGFVAGVLKNNILDKESMRLLMMHAHPCPITFHKAIDDSSQWIEDINWLNNHPSIDTILTSGRAVNAMDGTDMILRMKSIFKGNIMAGGKITPLQIPLLHKKLGLNWYHGRGIVGDL